ncbi:RNA-binding protein [Fuscovulum ytuae]|uniref:RNA-binding protein n=1 Tax=Fuscovulum ytuae TaxID=3042299 RepID=A0ABY8Q2P8_9RHOB|nr:RNA-binding protein [Fuscovulum sp. YMD61]WGV15110.1 RNA-binding protein [Fuscovulum sp. YMD61]
MARGGRQTDQDGPERKCIVSGQSQPKAGLIRFVIGPDAMVVPDVLARLPGRGIYVAADRAAIDKAAAKGLFSRAARQPVKVPDGLSDLIEAQLLRRVIDLVSMARKAGAAVTGYEKVKDWLEKGQASLLLQASDGSERGKTKLHPPDGEDSFIGCLSSGELGLAFGRERAIHAALAAGGLERRVVEEAARLAGIRGRIGGISTGEDTKTA